jgi:hypothetical protein
MLRLFVEEIARIEAALLVALCVTVLGMAAGLAFWLKARKSNSQNPNGS